MEIVINIFKRGTPLTGTTEERQTRMDEICSSLDQIVDLNSIRHRADSEGVAFKDTFSGFQSELKRPTKFNPDNGGGFQWHDEKIGNPVILDAAFDGLAQEDRLSYTFSIDGVAVDFTQPDHYRSRAARFSMVYGETPRQNAIAIQGNWTATIRGEWRSWWAFTALMVPSGDCEEWFDEFVSLNYGTNSYDAAARWIEEDRDQRERKYQMGVDTGAATGRAIAANI